MRRNCAWIIGKPLGRPLLVRPGLGYGRKDGFVAMQQTVP
jgi:hypothetical protein